LTWLALARGIDPSDVGRLKRLVDELNVDLDRSGRVYFDGKDVTGELQTPEVDAAVSAVSAHQAVREALRQAQRALIRPPGCVMAGRDIGTVIVPDADLKIWLDASAEERARRRAAQTGEPYPRVLEGMRRRDRLDASRAASPMSAAPDAITLQTDGVDPATVIEQIVSLARQRGALSLSEHA
jgi:cytidylate kinase